MSGVSSRALTARGILDIRDVAPGRFRSADNQRNMAGAIFGGQPLAQALAAAGRSAPNWPAHTCTAYFLSAGVVSEPVDYEVEALRDGRRFAARRVVARQGDRRIFDMLCAFHDPEPGLAHEMAKPLNAPDPENLPSLAEFAAQHAERVPALVRRVKTPFPVELRVVDPERVFLGPAEHAERLYWMRMPSAAEISDARAHQCLLAFASDYWLPAVVGAPHGAAMARVTASAAINHSLWFHAPLRMDDWILCRSESPWADAGRGLTRGLFYDRSGKLVASVAQEISMRLG